MDSDDSATDWSSGDEPQRKHRNVASSPSQPIRGARPPQRSGLRPARKTLPLVPYKDWVPGQSYEEHSPVCMHYIMEWKLTLNKKTAAKQTEDNLVVAPSDFWNEELASKIADIVQSTGKSYKADATTIAISVNDRSERDITKHFKELQIDWPVVEKQHQGWSHLLRIGKTVRVNVSFNYMESGKTGRTAGRGATAIQLGERDTRLDAEPVVSGAPDAWRQVYTILRCLDPPCDRGPYCWQDPDSKKHYKLMGHHLRSLVKSVQQGCKLERHDDVPQDIRTQLYAEEQQHLHRKRKRQNSGTYPSGQPMVINKHIPTASGQALTSPNISGSHSVTCASSRPASFNIL
ncbi:hypothetical protein N658DRAFT_291647 [Parathielavia hyrcaniae]|uniref:Uncharacterized protein n=1 Tax=Parathielavia hyrcaniae TaxID=113614 RepID=A0AAN6SY78_9PEZI|nr:hypothetical protein N658DRAFT_291647 [Parathielavia hyrcaniae]